MTWTRTVFDSLPRRRFLGAAALVTLLARSGVAHADPADGFSTGMPDQLDRLWVGGVPESVSAGTDVPTIPSAVELINMADPHNVTPGGGAALRPVEGVAGAFEFGWRFPGSAVRYGNPRSWFVQFTVEGAREIEFLVYTSTGGKKNSYPAWNLMIDDMRVWDLPRTSPVATDAFNLVKFTLPDLARHNIRFYMGSLALKAVFANPGASASPMPLRGLRAVFLGDSITQGTSQNTGWEAGAWLWRLAPMIGVDDAWNAGLGGTGFVADSRGQLANYVTRASTDVAPAAPGLVFVSSYFNDKTLPAAELAANVAQTLDILAGLPSKPQVVVVGAYDPLGSGRVSKVYEACDSAVKAECFSRGMPYVEPTTGAVYAGSGSLLLAEGGPWVDATTRTQLIGADNVHLTDAGQKHHAYRMCAAYRAIGGAM
jgi:lysophospholipase L1-like esterase